MLQIDEKKKKTKENVSLLLAAVLLRGQNYIE